LFGVAMRIFRKPRTIILAVMIVATVAATPLRGLAQPATPHPATNTAAMSGEARQSRLPPLAPVITKALEGDVREALRVLENVPLDTLDSSERKVRERMLRTFVDKQLPPIEVQDSFVAEVIRSYQDYWMRVLLHEATPTEGKEYLFRRLSGLLEQSGCHTRFRTLGKVLDEVGPRLRRKGFYSNVDLGFRITLPYWELMVWRSESNRTYKVKLPETTVKVKVVFMRDFVTLGWSALATGGRAFSGGWAGKNTLYCVADSYDPGSKSFEMSYVNHEAQHFADYKRFPKLEQPELEYRAELVGLILGHENARAALMAIASQTGNSRSAPHNYANLKVFTDISRAILGGDSPVNDPERWRGISDQAISDAAKGLLERNTKSLVARGASRVSRVLEDPMP
jgi:hypothetical protein